MCHIYTRDVVVPAASSSSESGRIWPDVVYSHVAASGLDILFCMSHVTRGTDGLALAQYAKPFFGDSWIE